MVVTTDDYISGILNAKGLYKEVLPYALATVRYFQRTDDKMRISMSANFLARTYIHLNNFPEALKYARQGLEAATAIKSVPETRLADQIPADAYEGNGDYRNALKYSRLYNYYSDSVLNETMLKKTAKLEARYEFEKKEARMKEEQDKKDTLNQHNVRIKELQISIALLVIFFLIVLALLSIRSRAIKQKNNRLLQENSEK